MSTLSDLMAIRQSAEPCINFEKSLKVDGVCSGFVPVQSTLDVFTFLKDATSTHASSRAAICYGTYGSGKSRLCVLLARLFKEGFDAPVLADVWHRIKDRGWGKHANDLRDVMCPGGRPWKPWLVVPMYEAGGGSTLDNALLQSLTGAVRSHGLPDSALGETVYDAAARRFEQMLGDGMAYSPEQQTSYPTAETLTRALREDKSQDALDWLRTWHTSKTAGLTLDAALRDQPNLLGSAHELYTHVSDHITAHGYEGIAVIWDEFGFALEELLRGAAGNGRSLGREAMDLQNFVELACGQNGGLNGKVVFLGFTHVSLNEYGSRARLNDQEKDRLDVVSGRFRQPDIAIRLSVTETEGYHLLGGMKELTPEGAKLLANEFPRMRALATAMASLPLWERFGAEEIYNDIVKTAYPLHPAAATVLLMLSDRIAQVNRTAFYFMHDRSSGGVAGQLAERELPARERMGSTELIRVADMFAFFEQAIREHNSEAYRKYEEAMLRIPDAEDIDEALVRTVLILKVSNVSPTTDMLAFCLCDARSEDAHAGDLHGALERCAKANALWKNEATAVWDFTHVGADIEEPIRDELDKIPDKDPAWFVRMNPRIQEELTEYVGEFDMEPGESGIVRNIRIEILDITKGKGGIGLINPAVGSLKEKWCSAAVYAIVAENDATIRAWRDIAANEEPSCTYFLIPQTPVELSDQMRRFLAMINLMDGGNLDRGRQDILDGMFTALRGSLRAEFARWFGKEGFRSGACMIVKAGDTVALDGITCWNDLLHHVAQDASGQFGAEIKVRCGSYNSWEEGTRLSPIEKIVERILDFEGTVAYHDRYLGFRDTSQEAAIVDGVLIENRYLAQDIQGNWVLSIPKTSGDESTDVIQTIRKHFMRGGGDKAFDRLFNQLIEPPFGLPNAIIPILVAFALREEMDRVALYVRTRGNPTRIAKTDLAKEIAASALYPNRYSSRYEQLSGRNRYVFKALGDIHRIEMPTGGEPFYEACRTVRRCLVDWAKGFEDVAASSTNLSDVERELMKNLRMTVPPQLPELAEALVKVFSEDAGCQEEMEQAGPGTTAFPHLKQHWRRLEDVLGRVTDDARAPVENLIRQMTEDKPDNIGAIFISVDDWRGGATPLSQGLQRIQDNPPDDAVELVARFTGKDPSQLGSEDFGRAKGILEAIKEVTPGGDELKVLMRGGAPLVLAPLDGQDSRAQLKELLEELVAQHGLQLKQIARMALDLLLENSGAPAGLDN